jgi:hypothetical protein
VRCFDRGVEGPHLNVEVVADAGGIERADEHLQRQGRECGGGSTRGLHEGAAGGVVCKGA